MAKQQYTAYDYGRQEWISGERARLLLIEQIGEDLRLLRGPNGPLYHRFLMASFSLPETIEKLEGHLQRLWGEA